MENFNKIIEFNKTFQVTEGKFSDFIKNIGLFLEASVIQLQRLKDENYFNGSSFLELQLINEKQFHMIKDTNYHKSFLNPTYSAENLGEGIGPMLSAYFYSIFNCINEAYRNNTSFVNTVIGQFFRLVQTLQDDTVDIHKLNALLKDFELELLEAKEILNVSRDYPVSLNIETEICLYSDLTNPNYLYKYGVPINANDLAFSALLSSYSQETIDKIAKHMADSYLLGFKVRNKNHKNRTCSRIVSVIGLERISKSIIKYLKTKGLNAFVVIDYSSIYNAQMDMDHKNDLSLFMDNDFKTLKLEAIAKAHKHCESTLKCYMGNIILLSFGQRPPKLSLSTSALSLDHEQQLMLKELNLKTKQSFESYVPKSEISYTGMAFPCSEVGENYKEIFQEVLNINLLDPTPYLKIQNTLIETLDKGKYAVIKGCNGNKTDLRVALQPIANPDTESNFMSCGADVNIPIGEVYTSPQLSGTNGTLHVKEIVVSKKVYYDLLVSIKDGFVCDFSCSNFDNPKEGKEYIQNNLFNSNSTLAVGEFAIGTNTYAYAVSKRLGIVNKLHTLIVEKMGPHIALGDTCCAWNEDNVFIDLINKKRFTASDNEKSSLRKCDISKAYFNTHKDITIPYDDVKMISIFTADDEEIQIIKDGKFVLPGCEYLNIPL